jgi:hypothetical protein
MTFALCATDLDAVTAGRNNLCDTFNCCPEGVKAPYNACDDQSGPTNAEVYSAFFDGVRKGMGK